MPKLRLEDIKLDPSGSVSRSWPQLVTETWRCHHTGLVPCDRMSALGSEETHRSGSDERKVRSVSPAVGAWSAVGERVSPCLDDGYRQAARIGS